MGASKEEFLEIISRYQGILHKVSLVYFRNPADREDIFQEILFQLWKSYPTLQNKQSIGSWIYAVSINTSLSRLKKESRIEYRDSLPEQADSSNTIEEISMNEKTRWLIRAMASLNDIDKSIMLLYLEEKSYDEIADILGISKSNVGVRINRAKETLRQHFNQWNHGK